MNTNPVIVSVDVESSTVHLLAELTLALLLFADASSVTSAAARKDLPMTSRLLGVGLPLSIIAGAGLAVVLFPSLPVVTFCIASAATVLGIVAHHDEAGFGALEQLAVGVGVGAGVAVVGDRPAWFGPRGLASVVFALLAVEDLGDGDPRVLAAVHTIAITIVFSIVAHGLTARPMTRPHLAELSDARAPHLGGGECSSTREGSSRSRAQICRYDNVAVIDRHNQPGARRGAQFAASMPDVRWPQFLQPGAVTEPDAVTPDKVWILGP